MRLALLLWLTAGSRVFGAPAPAAPMKPMERIEALFAEKRHGELINELDENQLHKLSRSELPRAYQLIGLSHWARGDIDKALSVFQLAAGLFPKDINILSDLATLLAKSELEERALPLYERVLKIHPNNSAAHLGLAQIQHKQGLLDKAAVHYEAVLKSITNSASIYAAYAKLLSHRREYDKALAAIDKALRLEPNNVESLAALARTQRARKLGKEAFAALDRAIAAGPEQLELKLQRVLWLVEDGRTDEAASENAEVLRRSPSDPLALWTRGFLALKRGDRAAAASDFESAAKMRRKSPFVASVAESMLFQLEQ